MFLLKKWGVPHIVHRAEPSVSGRKAATIPFRDPSSPGETKLLHFLLPRIFQQCLARDSILSDIY